MNVSLRGWLVLGGLTTLALGVALYGPALVNAADPPTDNQLTQESLGELLRSLGLEPKQQEGRYDFHFRAVHDEQEWELSLSAVLSQNGESIWVMAWLDELPRSAAEVPRSALLRLLADNDKLGNGKFFAYIPQNRRFVLQRVVPNTQMTPQKFRGILRDLGTSVVQTYAHWSTDHWTDKKTAGGADEARQ